MKVIAKKINNPNCDYLTEGKEYKVEWKKAKSDKFKIIYDFLIIDDFGDVIECNYKSCKHIKGNWTIITDKAKVR